MMWSKENIGMVIKQRNESSLQMFLLRKYSSSIICCKWAPGGWVTHANCLGCGIPYGGTPKTAMVILKNHRLRVLQLELFPGCRYAIVSCREENSDICFFAVVWCT